MTRASWVKFLVIVVFACGLVAKAAWSGAYSTGFEPYPNAKHFPTRNCQLEHQEPLHQEYGCHSRNASSSIVMQGSKGSALYQVRVLRNGSLKAQFQIAFDLGIDPWFDDVIQGDLTRDGLPDYVLVQPSGGNGLASEYCLVIFVLSGKSGYVVTKMSGMGFDPSDVLQLEPGQTNVVHTWFVSAEEPSTDGKYHNYWVYHFLKVRGTKLVFDSQRKPIWIQYKFKYNHTPTQLVSSSQKIRWWNKQKQPFFWR